MPGKNPPTFNPFAFMIPKGKNSQVIDNPKYTSTSKPVIIHKAYKSTATAKGKRKHKKHTKKHSKRHHRKHRRTQRRH
jgi:hypothetical protein